MKIFIILILLFSLSACSMMTPLTKAAREGDIQTLQTTIKNGANVNEPSKGKNSANPIFWALWSNLSDQKIFEMTKLLVENGANVNARDESGYTPLHWAVSSQKREVVKYLITKGADCTAKGNDGKTPLALARRSNNCDIIRILNPNKIVLCPPSLTSDCIDSMEQNLSKNKKVNVEINISGDPSESAKRNIINSIESNVKWALLAEGLEKTNDKPSMVFKFDLDYKAVGAAYSNRREVEMKRCFSACSYQGNITASGFNACQYVQRVSKSTMVPASIGGCWEKKSDANFTFLPETSLDFFYTLFGPFHIMRQQYYADSYISPSQYLNSRYAPRVIIQLANDALLSRDNALQQGAVIVVSNSSYFRVLHDHKDYLDTFIQRSFATNNHRIIEKTLYMMRMIDYYPDRNLIFNVFKDKNVQSLHEAATIVEKLIKKEGRNGFLEAGPLMLAALEHILKHKHEYDQRLYCMSAQNLAQALCRLQYPKAKEAIQEYNESLESYHCWHSNKITDNCEKVKTNFFHH